MSVPLGQFSFKARHFSFVGRQHFQIFRDLLGSFLPFLGCSDGRVYIAQIEPANTEIRDNAEKLAGSHFRPGAEEVTTTLFLGGGSPGGELLEDIILLFSFFFLRADLSDVSEI